MSGEPERVERIAKLVKKGLSNSQIARALTQQGWTETKSSVASVIRRNNLRPEPTPPRKV